MQLLLYRSVKATSEFDLIIGYLEDIIICKVVFWHNISVGNEFQTLQEGFMEENYRLMNNVEDKTSCDNNVHSKYVSLIGSFLEQKLREKIPEFVLRDFLDQVSSRAGSYDGEIFEILATLTDFAAFKELMVDYSKASIIVIV
uniref:ADP-ribosylation factor-like protein 2-binding protein n=1 Tax=Mesocestoides corti TaxID=53468 RepID=A0A5K3EHZ5_MESCO